LSLLFKNNNRQSIFDTQNMMKEIAKNTLSQNHLLHSEIMLLYAF
jgi:hypothetical protein